MAQEIADSTLLDTWSSGGNIVEPDISKIIEGWQLGEQPPHEYMNWLQNTFGSKLNHILKNGVASWNNETEYLAGSSVQHNGNVWLCKTTNTNSEPTDVNANWKRIITVESLTSLLNGYVATTGNQTIAGVKTFSSNPLSTATQSTDANALTKYSAVVKNSGDETIAGIKTFSSFPITPSSAPATNYQVANKKYVDDKTIASSETIAGIIEIATFTEAQAGTDDTRAITPLKLRNALNATGNAPIYACRARVTFNGQTASILSSGNISSITNNGVGDETVNLITAMPDANYQIQHTISQNTAAQYSVLNLVSKTTTSFRVQTSNLGGALLDVTTIDLTIVG